MAHIKKRAGKSEGYRVRRPLCKRWSMYAVKLHPGGGGRGLEVEMSQIQSLAPMRSRRDGTIRPLAPFFWVVTTGNTRYHCSDSIPSLTDRSERLMVLQIKCSAGKLFLRSIVPYSAGLTHMTKLRRYSETT